MKCDDPAWLTLVMPTRERPAFVARALGFLAAQGFRGRVLCVDASDDEGFMRTAEAIASVPAIAVIHHRPETRGNAWREIAEALAAVSSAYIQLHHDDDFYFVDEIELAIEVLETDPTAATAQGRFVFVEAEPDGTVSLANHDRFQYLGATAAERVSACMARFGHLLYAVARREDFAAALDHVHRYLDQGWFDQYAISLLLAARGRARVMDALYGVRERHGAQHHRQFKGPTAYKHWPLILAAPDFSETYAAFKQCVIDGVGHSVDTGDLAARLDEGLVHLVERAVGRLPERDAGDVALFERANRPGTPEHDRLKQVIAALRRHTAAQT